jgi:hypothetical protein
MSAFDCANQSFTGPASVEARKNRYFPLLSNAGLRTSLSPSLTWNDLPCSVEYAYTVVMPPGWASRRRATSNRATTSSS